MEGFSPMYLYKVVSFCDYDQDVLNISYIETFIVLYHFIQGGFYKILFCGRLFARDFVNVTNKNRLRTK